MERLEVGHSAVSRETYTPKTIKNAGIEINQDGTRRTPYQLLAFPNVVFDDVVTLQPDLADLDIETRVQLSREALYANYIVRQQKEIDRLAKDEAHKIPPSFDYSGLEGLSNELTTKLNMVKPYTLAQAGRIDGMTPAALALILGKIRQMAKKSA
jgi:tRNA uridine 5-carboxymethylaminomethyl modification enzyme